MNKTYINISNIPKRKYEGYVWMSDQKDPIILTNEEIDFSKYNENDNPFIIEALLLCNEENLSLIIRHTGIYHISEIMLNNLPEGSVLKEVSYLPHRIDQIDKSIKRVNFKQLWLPEVDENCENFEVLKMKALIFTGFDNKYK